MVQPSMRPFGRNAPMPNAVRPLVSSQVRGIRIAMLPAVLALLPAVALSQPLGSLAPAGARPPVTAGAAVFHAPSKAASLVADSSGHVGVAQTHATASAIRPALDAPGVWTLGADGARPRKPRLLWPYFSLVGAAGMMTWAGVDVARSSRDSPPIGLSGGALAGIAAGMGAVSGAMVGGVVDVVRRAAWRKRVRANADNTAGAW